MIKKVYPYNLVLILILLWTQTHTSAGDELVPATYTKSENLALEGYDSVSYFSLKEGEDPVKGDKTYQTRYMGAIWYFANSKNLETFKKNPLKYAPQFGGYCSYAVSKNGTASGDPEAYFLHQGKLYLNYNKVVRFIWKRNKEENIQKGNTNWPNLHHPSSP